MQNSFYVSSDNLRSPPSQPYAMHQVAHLDLSAFYPYDIWLGCSSVLLRCMDVSWGSFEIALAVWAAPIRYMPCNMRHAVAATNAHRVHPGQNQSEVVLHACLEWHRPCFGVCLHTSMIVPFWLVLHVQYVSLMLVSCSLSLHNKGGHPCLSSFGRYFHYRYSFWTTSNESLLKGSGLGKTIQGWFCW